MNIPSFHTRLFLILLTFPLSASAETTHYENCLLKLMRSSSDELTLGEMKSQCGDEQRKHHQIAGTPKTSETSGSLSPVEERLESDESNLLKPFTLMAHNPNYLLPFAYNFSSLNSEKYQNTNGEEQLDLDKAEVQFQLSIKMPIAVDIWGSGIDAYGAYTMRSFWQAYNTKESSPFRETNHEPEIWMQRRSNLSFGSLKNVLNGIGIVHQSNGQGGSLSRSWNRAYATFGFELGDFAFIAKPWFRFEESSEDDNNRDIMEYLGHGELIMTYKQADNVFSMVSRNNLESGFSKGSLLMSWSFPLLGYDYMKGYIQYFTGYGESLIDYNHYVNRIGVGLLLTDYL